MKEVIRPLNKIINEAQILSDYSKFDQSGHRMLNTNHLKEMVPLIVQEAELDDDVVVTGGNSKIARATPDGDLNPNLLARDNYKLKSKVFRNSSHYFSRAQDVSPLDSCNYENQLQQLFIKRQKSPQEMKESTR